MKDSACEVNFDGIVGPTHNYSGLSYGNIASQQNQYMPSNPREAALQGLDKMKFLADLGFKQAVLPPHERPHLPTLHHLGFNSLEKAFQEFPDLLLAVSSAAAMWTANAATISPSADSQDQRLHITSANLISKIHRSIETPTTNRILKAIFKNSQLFAHHLPLLSHSSMADEGAANHTRFCKEYGMPGVQLFVFGRSGFNTHAMQPTRFPARQTLEASKAIARLHQVHPEHLVFAQQHPEAIDAGAFHNDVVSVGNKNVFLLHEQSFLDQAHVLQEIQRKVANVCYANMIFLEVNKSDLPLEDAINTYLFNSQLLSLSNGEMSLIAPIECQENERVRAYLENLLKRSDHPIKSIHYLNLRQSMRNGGGPACLRLRIVMTPQEIAETHPQIFLTDALYNQLRTWIKKHYRDRLLPQDLADPLLMNEIYQALEDLTDILKLGPIYDFQ